MTHEYADWDGAYVMGALSRTDRQEYEAHLATCDECTRAVAELSPLPGLLGRLAPEDAELLLEPVDDPPASIATPRVVPISFWRRTSTRAALAAVAAAVVAVAVVVPITVRSSPHPDETVALARRVANPLSATVSLTAVAWGTRVDMTCVYAGEYGPQRSYALYVLDRAGHASLVSRWHAGPGDTARTTGSTDLDIGAISEVQLRAQDGTVLLSAKA